MDVNRMRIICNPFKKEIEYQWYDVNLQDYVEVDPERSKLAGKEYTSTAIQARAYELLQVINEECNPGNMGLEIAFVGCREDYEDLCKVVNAYFGDSGISVSRDRPYYNSASEIMPRIMEKYAEIKSVLEAAHDGEVEKKIDKYNDAVKPSIAVCVMGVYSAGKSAFINSLIGAEVLPSKSDPTTARVCRVCSGEKYKISFLFDDKECVLTFNGNKYKPNRNCSQDIIRELEGIIGPEDRPGEVFHMNRALDVINEYKNEEHVIGDLIEIWLPFQNTGLPAGEFDFVIYDTPGVDSASNPRHFEVFKNSLSGQTNALPVLLTTSDDMDKEGNAKMLSQVREAGTSLDTANALVVVNKADEKGPKTLGEKKTKSKELGITKWKSTQIFFLSSLMGIASKKNNPDDGDEWLDEDMYEIFGEKKEKYISDERKLFEYNIVDQSKDREIKGYPDDRDTTHLYRNSGLEAVERELAEYARKYALRNKCQKASDYLQEAIDLCVSNIRETERELDGRLNDAQGKFDSGKQELYRKLEKKKEDIFVYNTQFQELMGQEYLQFAQEKDLTDGDAAQRRLRERLQAEWEALLEEGKKIKKEQKLKSLEIHSWALPQFERRIEDLCREYLADFTKRENDKIEEFWRLRAGQFRKACVDIVHDSNALTAEQKEILKSVVLTTDNMTVHRIGLNLRQAGSIRRKKFIFWETKGERLDMKKCCSQVTRRFNDVVRSRLASLEKNNGDNFKSWAYDLTRMLTAHICEFNPAMREYSRQIEDYRKALRQQEECEKMMTASKEYIDGLLGEQGGGDID